MFKIPLMYGRNGPIGLSKLLFYPKTLAEERAKMLKCQKREVRAVIWKVGEGDAYALLATLLREEGMESLPRIERQEGGKPWFPERPHLHFSLSHSRGLSLCAFGEAPLGADIEVTAPRSPGLPRYALSSREYAWFQSRGGRWEDFYTLWTLKEARVKCTGEGIFRRPPRQISVPLLEPGEEGVWEGFAFTALAGADWRGGLCLKNL